MTTRRKKILAADERALEERSYENGDSPYVFDVSLDEMLAWIDIGGREVTLDELQDALAWAAAEPATEGRCHVQGAAREPV